MLNVYMNNGISVQWTIDNPKTLREMMINTVMTNVALVSAGGDELKLLVRNCPFPIVTKKPFVVLYGDLARTAIMNM